jgi:hypothetical protein
MEDKEFFKLFMEGYLKEPFSVKYRNLPISYLLWKFNNPKWNTRICDLLNKHGEKLFDTFYFRTSSGDQADDAIEGLIQSVYKTSKGLTPCVRSFFQNEKTRGIALRTLLAYEPVFIKDFLLIRLAEGDLDANEIKACAKLQIKEALPRFMNYLLGRSGESNYLKFEYRSLAMMACLEIDPASVSELEKEFEKNDADRWLLDAVRGWKATEVLKGYAWGK